MKDISMVSDEFIICSANSTKQVIAIADNIEKKLDEQGIKLLHKEGYREEEMDTNGLWNMHCKYFHRRGTYIL